MLKWESLAQLGKSKWNDLLSEFMFRMPLSCIIRHAVQWLQSPLACRGDFSTVAYVVCFSFPIEVPLLTSLEELQRITSRTLDLLYSETNTPSGLLVDVDYLLVIKTFERQIQSWYEQVADADSKL